MVTSREVCQCPAAFALPCTAQSIEYMAVVCRVFRAIHMGKRVATALLRESRIDVEACFQDLCQAAGAVEQDRRLRLLAQIHGSSDTPTMRLNGFDETADLLGNELRVRGDLLGDICLLYVSAALGRAFPRWQRQHPVFANLNSEAYKHGFSAHALSPADTGIM